MNPQDPQKINLSSTSAVSLHDRFTGLLKHQQSDLMDVTASVKQQHAASLKNQRLALEMAHRPSVLSALRNTSNINNRLCKVSVKARLGQPMERGGVLQEHMGLGVGRGGQIKGLHARKGISTLHRVLPTLSAQRGQGQRQRGGCVNWARPMGIRGGRAIGKTGSSHCTSVSGAYSGKGWAKFNSNPVPSREELDKQLDEYMSKTKKHLDAELDAYMAQVDLEDVM